MIKREIKIIFFVLIFGLLSISVHSIENKIEFKVNNEIITSVDIKNEIKFLTSFNPNRFGCVWGSEATFVDR